MGTINAWDQPGDYSWSVGRLQLLLEPTHLIFLEGTLPVKPHKHKFVNVSYSKGSVEFMCKFGWDSKTDFKDRCRERRERLSTKDERKVLDKYDFIRTRRKEDDVHRVSHEFFRRFTDGKGGWKLIGYELSNAVEKWAKKYPDDVRIASVDDDHFSSSDLVFIEHKARHSYMGTSVVYIPQHSDGKDGIPSSFFMYPGHLDGIMQTLKSIVKSAAPFKKREREFRKKQGIDIKKNIKWTTEHELNKASLETKLEKHRAASIKRWNNSKTKKRLDDRMNKLRSEIAPQEPVVTLAPTEPMETK